MTPIDGQRTPYDDPLLIGALLRIPWETVRRRMLDGLHEQGFTDLNAAHLTILQYPGPSGLRPSELAERTRMSKQALNYLLGQMERLGYIIRRDRPELPGSKRVEVTKRGEQVVYAMRAIVSDLERQWEQDLGRERFAQLRELLVELQASLPGPRGSSRDRQGARASGR